MSEREFYRAIEALKRDLYRERPDRLEAEEKARKEVAVLKRRVRDLEYEAGIRLNPSEESLAAVRS